MKTVKQHITKYFWLVLLLISSNTFAQKNQVHLDVDDNLKTATELFHKQKYSAAQQYFDKVIKQYNGTQANALAEASYYSAICALELFHPDGDQKLIAFINDFSENSKVKPARFALANFYYRKRKYQKALDWYQQIDTYDLETPEQITEYNFKSGYSYFKLEEFDKAAKLFYEIKDSENKYEKLANYYYSHIQYDKGNYETALIGFQKLKNEKRYSKIVPYYIVQIYYFQKKYEQTAKAGSALMDTVKSVKDSEISKLVGDSYYKLKNFYKAEKYLARWQKSTTKTTTKDAYQLAYCYFVNGNYENAIERFEKILYNDDKIAQYSYYHLGQAYLKTKRKRHARSAFNAAAKLSYDEAIAEDALYNTAKLSYELSHGVYNNAIAISQQYLTNYPYSDKKNEVRKYMYNAFLTSKNYKAAIEVIDAMKRKDPKTLEVYQKINYLRAVDLFNNLDIKESKVHFDIVTKYPYDRNLIALARYWNAEASFRLHDYEGSIEDYKNFIYTPWAIKLPVYDDSHYGIGYAYFMQKDYKNAIVWFRKYLQTDGNSKKKEKLTNDTYLRLADAYMAQRLFNEAIEYYGKAIAVKTLDTDYAYYQKATANGILRNYDAKISNLQTIINLPDFSPYKDDAVYDIAKTQLVKGDKNTALSYFKKLTTDFPQSKLQSKALLGKGLLEYDLHDEATALKTFETVVNKYPATAQAREALVGIKNIYIDKGQGSEYLAYVEKLPFESVTETSQDSILYESAEAAYFREDYKAASNELGKYLAKFPNGFFALNANFYKAECDNRFYKYDEATKGYEFVVNEPFNSFTESAVAQLATIYTENHQTEKATHSYLVLEKIAEQKSNLTDARVGLMRIYYNTLQYKEAIIYAQKLIDDEQIANEILYASYLIKGKSQMGVDEYNKALETLEATYQLTKSVVGAEAKYYVAYIQYLQEEYKESEKSIFIIANDMPPYDYWIAKSFILLADNYVKLEDNFQAEHTLKSIIENYDGADLKMIAQRKLNDLKQSELESTTIPTVNTEELIEFDDNTNYDDLYEDEEK